MAASTLSDVLPVHKNATRYLHDLSTNDYSTYLKQCEQELQTALETTVDMSLFMGDDIPLDLIQELDKSSESIQTQYEHLKIDNQSLQEAKQKCLNESNTREPVESLADWQHYTQDTPKEGTSIPKSLYTYYEECLKANQDSVGQSSSNVKMHCKSRIELYLRLLPQLWKDPTAVIKDEKPGDGGDDDDDEDIKIEGGVVDLECPITCKQFVIPMISKKCGHTFDREGIINYLGGPNSRSVKDCPQAGCSKSVSIKDFEVDEVMKLRCQIAASLKERQKAHQELDSIDVI